MIRYMKDYDIERPDSDFPGYDEYFGYDNDEYKEPMEWDLFEDDDLLDLDLEDQLEVLLND